MTLSALPLSVRAGDVSCVDMFDGKSAPIQRKVVDRTVPPEGFKLMVWRYNSGLLDRDGQSTFSNAQIAELHYDISSKSYQLRSTDRMIDNRLELSPENAHSNADAGMPYHSDVVDSEMKSKSVGEGIFDRNQSFTFDTYEKYGYLTADQARVQREIARKKLKPEQVTFIEAIEPRTSRSLKKEFGEIPKNARLEPGSNGWEKYRAAFMDYKPSRNPNYELKVGASWIISGQADGAILPLALEADALVQPIDRVKYKYAFELGRASQVYSFGHDETMRATLFYALNEVIATGGRIEDAYVFAHAMDDRRATVFRRKYKMKEFSRYQDPGCAAEVVVMVPLSEILKIYKIEDFSKTVQYLNAQTQENHLSGADIYKKVLESRLRTKRNLSIRDQDRTASHVEIRDFARLQPLVARELQDKIGMSMPYEYPPMEDRDSIVRLLERWQKRSQEAHFTRLQGISEEHAVYQNDSFQTLPHFLDQQNAIEIYAPNETNSLKSEELLVAAYLDTSMYLKDAGIADPVSFLRDHQIHFAITSYNHQTKIESLQSVNKWFILRPQVVLQSSGFGQFGHRQTIHQIYWESQAFTADQVSTLAEKINTKLTIVPEDGAKVLKDPRFLAP